MAIVTHESYDSVLVGTGKQKGLEHLHTKIQSCLVLIYFVWRPDSGAEYDIVLHKVYNVLVTFPHQQGGNNSVIYEPYFPLKRPHYSDKLMLPNDSKLKEFLPTILCIDIKSSHKSSLSDRDWRYNQAHYYLYAQHYFYIFMFLSLVLTKHQKKHQIPYFKNKKI